MFPDSETPNPPRSALGLWHRAKTIVENHPIGYGALVLITGSTIAFPILFHFQSQLREENRMFRAENLQLRTIIAIRESQVRSQDTRATVGAESPSIIPRSDISKESEIEEVSPVPARKLNDAALRAVEFAMQFDSPLRFGARAIYESSPRRNC